jgi:hypothetical protein
MKATEYQRFLASRKFDYVAAFRRRRLLMVKTCLAAGIEPMKFSDANRGPLVRSLAAQYGFVPGIGKKGKLSNKRSGRGILLNASIARKRMRMLLRALRQHCRPVRARQYL